MHINKNESPVIIWYLAKSVLLLVEINDMDKLWINSIKKMQKHNSTIELEGRITLECVILIIYGVLITITTYEDIKKTMLMKHIRLKELKSLSYAPSTRKRTSSGIALLISINEIERIVILKLMMKETPAIF